jgi:MoaA/NifB/PqqE/SkfB family radical SAM enzyme
MDKINYAFLETTNHCNLNCSFCNREDVIGPLQHIGLEKWKILLNKISHHPIEECKLIGMGESLLHPEFDEIVKTFKEVFPKCFVMSATNCQYNISHNSKLRSRLEKSLKYLDMLYLSIDGYEENYERDRSPAKWSKLIKFLEDFATLDHHKCTVAINYVVNRDNIYDIPKIKKFVDDYNLDDFRLNLAQNWNEDERMSDDEKIWGYTRTEIDFLKKFQPYIKGKSPWTWSDCFWTKRGLYTTVEGDVKICLINTGAAPVGNIFESNIDDIRASEAYQNVATGCSTNCPTTHCVNCSYKELSPLLNQLGINN